MTDMAPDNKDSFFFEHGRYISIQHIKKNAAIPFKDNPQFPIIVDILSRKDTHHAILCIDFPANLHTYFIEAMLQHLAQETTPYHLRGVDLIYLDIANLTIAKTRQKNIERDFLNLQETLDTADKYILFMLPDINILFADIKHEDDAFLQRQLKPLLSHPKCRFLVFMDDKSRAQESQRYPQFAFVHVPGPTEADVMTILKLQRTELENFHHILIPEELLGYAYSLAERYISTDNTLENALLLLDSSSARASVIDHADNSHQFKPVLTINTLTNVLSGWTHIPAANLQLHKFKFSEFLQGMQQKIFGQDAALTILGHELQQSQAHVQQKTGPFCSLLFAGPMHSGKASTAAALADQLFKQPNVLYFAQQIMPSLHSIIDVKVQGHADKNCIPLRDLIRQKPYAIIVFENIDQSPSTVLDGLQEILATGYLTDDNGSQYNFRQTIIILSTTIGSHRLAEISKTFDPEDETHSVDLLQLVMNEQKYETFTAHHYTPQEISEEVMTELSSFLPTTLCQSVHIIPFLPLNKHSIEKIIRLKLKHLGKTLDLRHGIELGYAPEVIRYLAGEIIKNEEIDNKSVDIDKALKQLYFAVEQAILSQIDNKNRPNQLFLQLNETGQILRCDWLTMATARHHAS
jgi:ATP-dependent Clp protease ATP-binding subunit ClpA